MKQFLNKMLNLMASKWQEIVHVIVKILDIIFHRKWHIYVNN